MAILKPTGRKSGAPEEELNPGDILAGGESALAGAIATAGAGTWTGAAIATGIIRRTGPGAGYTDTTDTAANIIAALAGNAPSPDVAPGTTFRLLFENTVAFAHTFAAGSGVVAGSGVLNAAASTWREYLVTVLNASPVAVATATFNNASTAVTFVLPAGMTALPLGPSPLATNITPGMSVTGTGIAAGATVAGVTYGQGGITGVTLSANTTGASASGGNVLTFGPTVQFDGLRSGTL